MTRAVAVLAVAIGLAVLAPAPAHAAASGAVVVVGVPGLRAEDLTPQGTPTLWQLAETGAAGLLSTRAVRATTCPADGWLTLNAGARTALPGCRFPEVVATADGGARVGGLAPDTGFGARLGTLAASVDGCATAVGPGAALALADPDGRVAYYAETATAEVLARCPLTVVDTTIPQVDGAVAHIRASAPAGSTILVAGLADTGTLPRLHLVLAAGPRFAPGRLDSPSTRQPGLVQLTDLTPTVLDLLGATPRTPLVGSVATGTPDARPAAQRLPDLRGNAVAADVQRDALVPFFAVFTLALLALVALARFRGARAAATALAAVPVATFAANLVPWWTFPHPAVALTALVVGIAAALGAVAWSWRRHPWGPAAVVAGATGALLVADALTGSRLQIDALYGQSPLIAGRFYGFGNSTFAVFAVATLLLAAALAVVTAPRVGPVGIAVVGAVAVAVDGWPAWGADFGGVLALVPAFALLTFRVAGLRITWVRAALAGAGAVALVCLVATLDWLRPPGSRSHLGAFVQRVLDGDAGAVVARKAATNLHTFTDHPLALLIPVAVVVAMLLIRRPDGRLASVPMLRPGLAAVAVAAVVGLAVNDSGATVPGMALTLAVPLAVSVIGGRSAPDPA